jgi:hypothetical protein
LSTVSPRIQPIRLATISAGVVGQVRTSSRINGSAAFLVEIALHGTTHTQVSSALYALARTKGLALLGEEIERRLDAGDAADALRLADDVLAAIPDAPAA